MKRGLRIAGIAVVVLLLLFGGIAFLVDADQFRPRLEATLSQALGRQVTVGHLSVALLSGGVTASDLAVADDPRFASAPFLRARSLRLGIEWGPLLFSHELHITALTIEQPEIALIENPSGDWNFSNLGHKSAPVAAAPPPSSERALALSVKRVDLTGGRFSVADLSARLKPLVLERVNLELRDFAPASAFPFSFSATVAGGGQLKLNGQAGPIDSADTGKTPFNAALQVTQLDLLSTGLVNRTTGISGLVFFDGKAASNGQVVNLEGRLRAESLKLVRTGSPARRPVAFDFTIAHNLQKKSGVLRRGNLHFGSAPASLTGSYDLRSDPAALNLVFSGPNMAVPELAALLPALDIVLPAGSSLQGGTAGAQLSIQGPADRLVTTGSLGLSNTRLAGFNMGARMAVIQTLAGIPRNPSTDIQSLAANVRAAPEGVSVANLKLVVPTIGELTGGGTVSPSHALDFQMRTTLHTSGAIMAALGQRGDTTVPFLIQGTSSDPAFRPDVRAIATEKIQKFTGNSDVGKAASGLLDRLLGGKKKN